MSAGTSRRPVRLRHANGGSENVSAYHINPSGAVLTQVQGSPFAAGSYPWRVTIDPSDKFAYVTNYNSDNVSAYQINPSSGVLTQVQGSPFAAGSGSFGAAIDPTGSFLYVVNEHSNNVSAYQIQPEQWGFDAGAGVAVYSGR